MPSCEEIREWLENEYIPWYDAQAAARPDDDDSGGIGGNTPPPPPR